MMEHTAFNCVQYRLNTEDSMVKVDNACFLLVVNLFNKNISIYFITLLTFISSAYFEILFYLFILKHLRIW